MRGRGVLINGSSSEKTGEDKAFSLQKRLEKIGGSFGLEEE